MSRPRARNLPDKDWQQLPIPHRYQVLTWQQNVSFYPPAKSVKMVSSLRDPIENVELLRAGHEAMGYAAHLEAWLGHCERLQNFVEHVTGIHEPF